MFEGKFYDGRSSKGMPAFIELESNGIRISYQAGEEEGSVLWHLEGIYKSEFNDATTLLQYGRYPSQSLSVYDQQFEATLRNKYPQAAFLRSGYSSVLKTGVAGILLGGGCLLVLAVVLFVWGIPALADRAAAHFPVNVEQSLGARLHARMLQNYEVDSARTRAMQGYLQELEIVSDFPVQVTVVKNSVVNAFAVPGGFVVVHDGLLNQMENHEELAGLLGHEIGHVQMRHSTRALARSLSYYMFLSILFGDVSGVAAVLVDNAGTLTNLEYSRSAEQDADMAGLRLLVQNNLKPQGMVWLMNRLSSGEPEFMQYISTHPSTEDRIEKIKQEIKQQEYKVVPNPTLEAAWQQLQE